MKFSKLNNEQQLAIKYTKGPLLIIAGAGTGKTTVITEKVKWLISQKFARPEELLVLTYTDKASQEMEERIDVALPYGYTQMWISTFHAFGDRVLRAYGLEIGLDPGYKLMTGAEAIIFFRKNLFSFPLNYFRPLGNPNKFIEGILTHFSRLKDEDISPQDYMKYAKNLEEKFQRSNDKLQMTKEEIDKYFELAKAYQKYEELKVKEGVMDFGDLINNTLKLFRTRKNILREYQNQFKYILVDEFQDTNFAQNELAVLLAQKRKNITVVGDDDQAIYRWRGAAISNIIQFKTRFPETKLIVLKKNYRSTREILNKAYKLIQFNNPDRLEIKEKINKKLISERKFTGEKIELIYVDKAEDEAEEVIKLIKNYAFTPSSGRGELRIKNIKGEKKYTWKDFAILIRANNQVEPFIRALSRAGIPYQFLGPGALFRQPEVKDLIAYLKILSDYTDSVAVFRVLSMDIFKISDRDLIAVNIFAQHTGLSLYEAIEIIVGSQSKSLDQWTQSKNYEKYLPRVSCDSIKILSTFYQMIERHLKLIKKETAGQILYFFLEDSGLLQKFTQYKNVKEEKIVLNLSKFFNKIKSYESSHEDAGVIAVMDWINMSIELGESPLAEETDWTQNDAVNILTVHASKGLEFKVVFLVNLVGNRFPTIERKEKIPLPQELIKEILPEGDYHLEEERRLFYVGMTRACDKLFFTAASFYGEGKRERKLSPFVVEALGDSNRAVKQSINATVRTKLLNWKKNVEQVPKSIKQSINYLSYSQIATFLTCPLQYKYRYVLKIPVLPSAAGSFGTSIHLAMQKFYKKVMEEKKPVKSDLLEFFDKVWQPVGYGTRQYEEKMKKRGREMLSAFFEKSYNPKTVPYSLEQVFAIRLSENLKIGGKIDRVDKLADGKLEIIDYKTGKRPKEKEIKENLQMTLYALAATDPGIYNKKPEDLILSFYFFDTQEKISSQRTSEQLVKAKDRLITIREDIALSTFPPQVGPWCDFCEFRLICEAWQ